MKNSYPTPHIKAEPKDIAKTVLMPGDPLRAKLAAEKYLEDAVLFNNVRGIQGYTGKWNGVPVSIMASGMGLPSMGIYSYELFNFFGVENIIRIGSAGSMSPDVKIRDIVLGMGACTNSNYGEQYCLPGTFAPICSYQLLDIAVKKCIDLGASYHVGNLLSSDTFYSDDDTINDKFAKMGVLAVEMEAAALYMNAVKAKKKALCILTISDHLFKEAALSAEERQVGFGKMMEIALELA